MPWLVGVLPAALPMYVHRVRSLICGDARAGATRCTCLHSSKRTLRSISARVGWLAGWWGADPGAPGRVMLGR